MQSFSKQRRQFALLGEIIKNSKEISRFWPARTERGLFSYSLNLALMVFDTFKHAFSLQFLICIYANSVVFHCLILPQFAKDKQVRVSFRYEKLKTESKFISDDSRSKKSMISLHCLMIGSFSFFHVEVYLLKLLTQSPSSQSLLRCLKSLNYLLLYLDKSLAIFHNWDRS